MHGGTIKSSIIRECLIYEITEEVNAIQELLKNSAIGSHIDFGIVWETR